MAGNFNSTKGGAQQAAGITKADAILQRQAELAAKLDQLMGMANSLAGDKRKDEVSEKISTETAYLSKQTSAMYDKLAAENASLKQEMGYLALQCENVFTKLSGLISALESKVENGAVDYDKVAAIVAEQLNGVSEEELPDTEIEDEVAPAAYAEEEQAAVPVKIDYDEIAARVIAKFKEEGLGVDYDELAKKMADSMPPQEVLSPDYIASKVAEQIVIPQVILDSDGSARPVEIVPADIDYEKLSEKIAEKVFPEEQYDDAIAEAVAEDSASAAEKAAPVAAEIDTEALADEIARKIGELSSNDFDIIVDDEGCRSLAEALAEKLDYDKILEKLQQRASGEKIAEEESAVAEAEEAPAFGGIDEDALADKTAAAVSNYLPEFDMDELADKVATAVLATMPASEIDYDAIVNGVCEKLDARDAEVAAQAEEVTEEQAVAEEPLPAMASAQVEAEQPDYDVVIDEDGLQKLTDSISWKVSASTNAMLEQMDDKIAAIKKQLADLDASLAEVKAAEANTSEAKAEEAPLAEQQAEVAEAAVAESAPAVTAEDVAEINRKIDELTLRIEELLTPEEAEEAPEEETGEEAEADPAEELKAQLAEIKSAVEELKGDDKVDNLKAEVETLNSKIEELVSREQQTAVVAAAAPAEQPEDYDVIVDEEGLQKITDSISEKVTDTTNERFEQMESRIAELKQELADIGAALAKAEEEQPATEAASEETTSVVTAEDIGEINRKIDELTLRIEELLTPEPEEYEEGETDEEAEDEDPVEELRAGIEELKSSLNNIMNDETVQELKEEVATLTARIDELLTPEEVEEDYDEAGYQDQPDYSQDISEIKEEVKQINEQLDRIKALIVGGTVVTTVAAAAEEEQPAEEETPAEEEVPAEEAQPAAEEPAGEEQSAEEEQPAAEEPAEEEVPAEEEQPAEEEEELVKVSDIIDEDAASEEPVDEVMENILEDVEEQPAEGEAEPDDLDEEAGGVDFANMMKYNRSFIARIIQSSDDVKRYYGEIKNAMLAYRKVNSSIAWGAERFNKGRETIAKLKIRGKTLCLYLNLDPNEFKTSVYHQIDVSDNKSMHGTPMMVKIKSPLGVRKAIRLIDEMLARRNGEKRPIQERDYAAMYPYETIEELIEDGLVKDVRKLK